MNYKGVLSILLFCFYVVYCAISEDEFEKIFCGSLSDEKINGLAKCEQTYVPQEVCINKQFLCFIKKYIIKYKLSLGFYILKAINWYKLKII